MQSRERVLRCHGSLLSAERFRRTEAYPVLIPRTLRRSSVVGALQGMGCQGSESSDDLEAFAARHALQWVGTPVRTRCARHARGYPPQNPWYGAQDE